MDSGSYATLAMDGWSEADEDNVAFEWAECRAAALRRSLTGNPKLSARIDGLRRQVRQLRALEGSSRASARAAAPCTVTRCPARSP